MRPITPPLTRNNQGSEVVNLQDGLLLLLNRQFLRSIVASDLQTYLERLRNEQIAQAYGKVTTRLVAIFQEQSQLTATGEVDAPTAEALNEILRGLRAFDQPEQFIVRGRVFGSDSSAGGTAAQRTAISSIRVRAFDRDVRSEDLLGETITNQDGYYEIRYSTEQFRRSENERGGADLIVRVYDAQGQVIATSPTINNARAEETIDIVVQPQQPPEPNPDQFIVKGTIRQFNDKPFVGAIVRAFDRDLRREQLLGEKTTDRTGYYEISYTRAQFSRAEKDGADLIVRVYGESTGQPLVESDLIFNAKPIEIVDLVAVREEDRTRSLYERLMLELRPLLGEPAIADLREDAKENLAEGQYKDITFLAGETGFDKVVLARLVIAHKLAQQSIQPEFWFALLGSSIYQYNETQTLDEQLAAILEALPSLDALSVNKALSRSFNQNEIPDRFKENMAGWVEAFLQFIAKRVVSDSAQSGFVKLSLVDAGIEGPEKQEKFARRYNQYKAIIPELVGALQQVPSFTQPEINTLQTSFRLADLTQGDFSVVKAIKDEFDVRQPEQIRILAKRSENEWVNLATTKHEAGEINLPFEVRAISEQARLPEAEVYGKMLDRQFREAFPTTAFTGGLERALQNGGAQGIQRAETLGRFLDRHETFEFLKTPVDNFFQDNIDPEFRELATDANFRLEVKAVQRVFKLSPNSLSKNQRFEEARDWYHFIFNPIGVASAISGGSLMSKYWITKPFFETTNPQYIQQRIDNILRLLAGDTTVTNYSAKLKKDLEDQALDWRTNPFEPHRIANYRTVAYQKTVVMKYLDNLIAWGDNLFRQDSMESINEATQLYVLAAEILGSRPKKIPPQEKPPIESFNELETQFDKFSNALVQVENYVPVMSGNGQNGSSVAPLPMLYFCVPQNDKMLGYWDTVADRLYKIRPCMNIEGVVRQLALFEPPIDPGALVKAVAGGVDIGSALADLNAPLPFYRFNVLLQKANEVCNDVKALGSALLAALEKKDAEAMGLLRQSQEIRLLEAIKTVRETQIGEAKENEEGFRRSKSTVEERRNYYRDIEKVSGWETASMATHGAGIISEVVATILNATAGVAHLVPDITVGGSGFGGTPVATVKYGGDNFGKSAFNWAAFFGGLGGTLHSGANLMATQASNERRWEDWKLQERLADKELVQMDKQIAAAELRVAIAEKELENHTIQIENAKATDTFMRSKYTNQELYQWQIGQISGVYFQSYKLAYDMAKRAERCFRFELGLQDSRIINFGSWDSLKKGLLSGEKLQYDLRRLEAAYLEQNRREFELTKHISLTLLDPLALVKLRETGRCFINLPEEIFDLDYPGHYFRRIKSVSITLPCVVGPYTTISCTLRLLKNSIRINTAIGDNGYAHNSDGDGLPADDTRFIENNIPVKAIAASTAQNDSGIFELSFRDERYLPFEGAGAISQWSLELFNDNSPDFGKALRQFDYSTITDAILHIKYMAREDAGTFKNGAIAHLKDYFSQDGTTPSLQMFNLKQEFPTQWHRFLNPINPVNGNIFELEIESSLFPFRDGGKTLKVNTIWLLARCTNSGNYGVNLTPPLPPPPDGSNNMTLTPVNQYGGLHFAQKDVETEIDPTASPVPWQLQISRPGGNLKEEVEEVLLVLGYEW